MDFTTVLTNFIGTYGELFVSFFAIGISSMIARSYSQMTLIFSILTLVLYFIFSFSSFFLILSFLSFLASLVLKNIGL